MSLLGQCTFRRLLSNTHKWPTNRHSLPLITKRSTSYRWPIGPIPKLRDRDRVFKAQLFDTLLFLLRSGAARDYGLGTRHDGYLSVRKLLNYPLFRHMDMIQLQEIVDHDSKHRFQLLFDPSRGDEAWWIRAKLWDEKHMSLKPCLLSPGTRMGVYQTTIEEWNNHISRSGISRQGRKYIPVVRKIPTNTYIDNFNDESQVFIFFDVNACILAGLRFYYILETASHLSPTTPLVTKGNSLGLIPPNLFLRVEMVEAKKSLLWGSPNGVPENAWPEEPDDFDESGKRKTMLPLLAKNLHGFADFYNVDDVDNHLVHPETIREAMEVAQIS